MGPPGWWMLPAFLLVGGLLLVADGLVLAQDANATAAQNQAGCSASGVPCSPWTAPIEWELGWATAALGAINLLVGAGVAAVRWVRISRTHETYEAAFR